MLPFRRFKRDAYMLDQCATMVEDTVHEIGEYVNIVKVSKPFVLDGVEYVIGTPRKETHRRGSAPSRTSATARKRSGIRCEECGSTKGVHLTRDINGIGCLLCSLCDDGSASVC